MTQERSRFSGVLPAILTPFTADGADIDIPSLKNLIGKLLAAGVDGIVACGSTGESSALNDREYAQVIETARELIPKDKTLISGISVSSTARAVELAQIGKRIGVDGILVASPPYNKPSQQGLIAHFAAVKEASHLPVIAYNIPGRSGVQIFPATIIQLACEGTIVGVKESSGSIDNVLEISASMPSGFALMSGEDSLTYSVMSAGGTGVISASASAAPEGFVKLVSAIRGGDYATALKEQLSLLPLIKVMFRETNPIPVKAAAWLRGWISSHAVRLPLLSASNTTIDEMREALKPLMERVK